MFLADSVCTVCGIEFDPEDPDADFYAVDGICSIGCIKDMFENEDMEERIPVPSL